MSGYFIFEIKRAKMDKIFNFLEDRFSVIGRPMDMIFGMFSQVNVRLLNNIISQLLSKYNKRYNVLNVKSCLKLNGF